MKLDDLTIGDAKELSKLFNSGASSEAHPFEKGQKYFIRTVTHHQVGRCVDIKGRFIVLEDASWVADDGRFSTAMSSGEFSEVEPFGDVRVFVNAASIIDVVEWPHELPRGVK